MPLNFKSPQIKSILSDYRHDAVVPEDKFDVLFGDSCFKIAIHGHADLYYSLVNASCEVGAIFIFPDYYRYDEYEDADQLNEDIHENDHTYSLCPGFLEVEDNYEAPLDGYRIIIMTAV